MNQTSMPDTLNDPREELADILRGAPELLAQARASILEQNPGRFNTWSAAPISRLIHVQVHALVADKDRAHSAVSLFHHVRFLRVQLRHAFDQYEGSACCADKAGAVLRALARHFMAGEPIAFDTNDSDSPVGYAMPQRILTTQAEVLDYFQALLALYYGNLGPAQQMHQIWSARPRAGFRDAKDAA